MTATATTTITMMMVGKRKYHILMVALILTSAIHQLSATTRNQSLQELRQDITRFSAALYKTVIDLESSGLSNVFISPIAINTILSLLHQGAQGTTKEVLENVLNLPGKRQSLVNYEALVRHLLTTHSESVNFASVIFLRDGLQLESAFQNKAVNRYMVQVQQLNFANQAASALVVNDWIKNMTKGNIIGVANVEDFHQDLLMLIANALHFKQYWPVSFDATKTKTDKFFYEETSFRLCNMMSMHLHTPYYVDEYLDAKILSLPYSDFVTSMIIILPNKRSGLRELEQKLAVYDFNMIYRRLEVSRELDVLIPRFKISYEVDLEPVLKRMGLGKIFSTTANFSEIVRYPSPRVEKVKQKTFIDVNEKGTEAASATVFAVTDRISVPPIKEPFRADHPFVFLITSTTYNYGLTETDILFMGRFASP